MTDFVISYDYNHQIIEETYIFSSWFNLILYHYLGKWLLPIFTAFFTVLAIVMRTQFLTTLSLVGLLVLFIIHLSKSYAIQIQKDRTCLMHGGQLPHMACVINTSAQQLELMTKTTLPTPLKLDAVKTVKVSSQLIIFCFKGYFCVPIPRQGFQQGTAEDLLFWLEQNLPAIKISYL